MDKGTPVYTKVKVGADSDKGQTRIWVVGSIKGFIAELEAKGFEVITKRPSRAKPKAEKAPKAAKKSKRAKKELVAA
jgi:hypothetical protein